MACLRTARGVSKRHARIVLAFAAVYLISAGAVPAQDRPPTNDAATAERFVHEVWTVEDGLPVNSINALVQSQDGYLWAATFDGLVRFDGVRFVIYNTGNSPELPSNRIVDLIEAQGGDLWMRTEQNHLVRFRGDVFTHFQSDHGMKDNTTLMIAELGDGTVWVGTDSGVGFVRDEQYVPVATDVIRIGVRAIERGRDGTLWVGTDGAGLYRVVDGEASIPPPLASLSASTVISLHEDASGTLWIGTDGGAYQYRDRRVTATGGVLAGVSVWELATSPSTGALWMLTEVGVFRSEQGRVTRVRGQRQNVIRPRLIRADTAGHMWYASGTELYRDGQRIYGLGSPGPDDPIPITEIRALLRDREGSIWLGTNASGLHRLKPALFTVYSEPEGIAFRNIYSVYQDRSDALWIGTWGRGLSRLSSGRVTNFTPDRGYPLFVMSLMEDREGHLWVGTFNLGAWRCSLPALTCDQSGYPPLQSASVFAMHEDRSGRLWFGTSFGIFRYDHGTWTRLSEEAGAPTAPARVFWETRDGALWMGTNGSGLARYSDGRFTHVTAADGLPSDLIRSLYEDADGWLWIGTEGRGLVRLDPRKWGSSPGVERPSSRPITQYRVSHGLFDEVIHQILEDDDGRLWMSTNRGIFWVARNQLNAFAEGRTTRIHSTGYTEREGLRNREANGGAQPAGIKGRDGRLWFPTQDGVVVVDPKHLLRNQVPPPVVIEHVMAGSDSTRPGADAIEIAAGQRDLQIDYTALSFMAPENVRFRYRLEGYNTDWVDAGNRRSAFYTNVPPGRYAFHVIASNNDGVWNEQGAAVALHLAPHFYETKSWYLFIASALGLLVIAAVRWRVGTLRARAHDLAELVDARTAQLRAHEAQLETQNAQLEAQAEKLAELDRAKSRFFANISHEFRTPLTLTIGPLEDLLEREQLAPRALDDVDLALRNARRLLRLVNQILDVAKLEAGQMQLRAREEDLTAFLRRIAEAFAPLAERKQVRFRLEVPSSPVTLYYDPDLIEKVLANLLSNAFKFTPREGTVRLSLDLPVTLQDESEWVTITVRDSGPGIPAEGLPHVFERFYQAEESGSRLEAGTGIGLSLAKELVELHRGIIGVESEMGFGTTFTVHLRRGCAHLDPAVVVPAPRQRPATPQVAVDQVAEIFVSADGAPVETSDSTEDVTTILVVDDNPDVRSYLRRHLERTYRVLEAAEGRSGVDTVRRELPDLVICDVMMPEMDGRAVCRALKQDPETEFVPVILLTAKAATEDKIEGLEVGADDYVTKPFDMQELSARVENLIASRKRLLNGNGGRGRVQASSVEATSSSELFLERLRSAIEEHLADADFTVERLASLLGQSRSNLHRRVRAIDGRSPQDVVRAVRLERAQQLLEAGAGSVSEIAYGVGFKSVSHFSRSFRQQFGMSPSKYTARKQTRVL